MYTFSIALTSDSRPDPKVVSVDAETALQAMAKAKADNPDYPHVAACSIVTANY